VEPDAIPPADVDVSTDDDDPWAPYRTIARLNDWLGIWFGVDTIVLGLALFILIRVVGPNFIPALP
jgi:hypothetical protein